MSIPHAASGELIDIFAPADSSKGSGSMTLVRGDHIEVFRLILPAGKTLQKHAASGSITIQCLAGVVELEAHERTQTLLPGTLVYLDDAQPHAVSVLEDASLLITMLLRRV
jgi:quercetin dioxygenase-like cupin family protein